MTEVLPAADLLLGGAMLIVIIFIHATCIRFVTNQLVQRSEAILQLPTRWRADLLMSGTVFALLDVHLVEIFVWSAALISSGLVAGWHAAGFFAGNTLYDDRLWRRHSSAWMENGRADHRQLGIVHLRLNRQRAGRPVSEDQGRS